jgi:hypothetical protein
MSEYVGKTVLIGLTFLTEEGEVGRREQFGGRISSIGEDVIRVELTNGKEYGLPPDLTALRPAPPGVYKSTSSGEVFENPDFLASWTISPPEKS